MTPQLTVPTLRFHILLLFLEFPELRLDGNSRLLSLRVFHVDVKVLGEVVLLFIWGEVRENGEKEVEQMCDSNCINLQRDS